MAAAPRALAAQVDAAWDGGQILLSRRAVEVHAHAGEVAVRLDLARLDLRHGEAGLGQAVTVEPQEVVVGDEVQEALVAHVVLRAQRGTLGRRDLERVCWPPGPLNEPRLIMSHMPVAVAGTAPERVVVVVRDAQVVRELVRVDGRAGALGLGRAVALRARPHVRGRRPRGPRDVPRRGPVAARVQRVDVPSAERVGHRSWLAKRISPNSCHVRLVLARGRPEDVVERRPVGGRRGRATRRARRGEVLVARRRGRARAVRAVRVVFWNCRCSTGSTSAASGRGRTAPDRRRTCRRSPPSSTGSWSGSCSAPTAC